MLLSLLFVESLLLDGLVARSSGSPTRGNSSMLLLILPGSPLVVFGWFVFFILELVGDIFVLFRDTLSQYLGRFASEHHISNYQGITLRFGGLIQGFDTHLHEEGLIGLNFAIVLVAYL